MIEKGHGVLAMSFFARNVSIFGVDNSWSSHTNNRKNKFLVFGEGPTQGINDSTGAATNLVLTLVKQIQNFADVYITKLMRVTCMQIKQRFTNLRQNII